MILPIVRLEVYKKQFGTSSDDIYYLDTPSYIITDFENLVTTHGIEKRKDKITFNLYNHRELFTDGSYQYTLLVNNYPEPKDMIKLYAWNSLDGTTPSNYEDYLIMAAYVKSFDYSSTDSVARMSVVSFNRTEVLMNSFVFYPYNEGQRVPVMIVDSMSKLRNYNKNDIVYAYMDYNGTSNTPGVKGAYNAGGNRVYYTLDTNKKKIFNTVGTGTPEIGYIRAYKKEAYKTDGSGELKDIYSSYVPDELMFPSVVYVENYKAFIDAVIDISSDKYTEDVNAGIYMNYVDEGNNLHWLPKEFSIANTIYEHECSSISFTKDIDEVSNAIITNAGTDPNQNGILALSFDASSMGLNGARWKYLAKTNIADDMHKAERNSGDRDENGVTIPGGDNNGKYIGDDGYPDTFPWTIQTTGSDKFGNWNYVAKSTTVSNRTEYKNYFRRVAQLLGKKAGDDAIKYAGEPLIKGSWELEYGNNYFSPGQMINLFIDSVDLEKKMRIMSITHNFSESWSTTLEIEEDIDYNLQTG